MARVEAVSVGEYGGFRDDGVAEYTGASWPPSTSFNVDATSFTTIPLRKSLIAGTYYSNNVLLTFATGAHLPDDALILSASLRLNILSAVNANGRTISGEYFPYSPVNFWSESYSLTPASTAFDPVAISNWTSFSSPGSQVDFTLKDVQAQISRTALTQLRLHVSDTAAPTGENRVTFSTFENTLPEPQLVVSYVAPPTFRDSSSNTNGGVSAIDIPTPVGVQERDVMVAAISVKGGSAASCTPTTTGWTIPSSNRANTPSNEVAGFLFHKVATAAEPATQTFTLDSARYASGGIAAYSNADLKTVIDVKSAQANASSTSITAASVTTTLLGDTLVFAAAGTKQATYTPPSGMSERVDRSG